MPSPPPVLGVVIVSFNTRELLDACLRTLHAELEECGWLGGMESGAETVAEHSTGWGPAQVWVVDNASSDGSAEMVRRRHPWVHLRSSARNVGFTAGNNLVLTDWARGEDCPARVLLLNPDTELRPGSLPALAAALDHHPDCGAVGPRLVYADGTFQHAAFVDPGLVQAALDLWPVPRLQESRWNGRYPRRRYQGGEPFGVDFVLGACLMMRGEALRAVGPLDEGYFMYCEEIDWCRRAREQGWTVLCVPAAVVLHHGGASSAQFRGASFVELWRSRLRFADLHLGPLRGRAFRWLLRLGLAWRRWRDGRAVRAGKLGRDQRRARAEAYREIWRPRPGAAGGASAPRAHPSR